MLELNTNQTDPIIIQKGIEVAASIPGWAKYLMIIGVCIAGYYAMKYAGLFDETKEEK
jgi:hypothetical protein